MIKTLLCLSLVTISIPAFDTGFDDLPMNKIQLIGSHNSYKQAIDPHLIGFLRQYDSPTVAKFEYNHISIPEQLDLGLRNLEIDIYADEQGGKYAYPKGLDWVTDQSAYDSGRAMQQPGFKVMHIQDIDFRTSCYTLQQCLTTLKQWSQSHPDHYPVFITINAKDETMRSEFTTADPFTAALFDQLDKNVLQFLGREKIITPDDIRGNAATLEEAVLAGKWPLLKNVKGKFFLVLDETGDKRKIYIDGHPSLKGRALFANAEPGTPEAAFVIKNDPKKDNITELVKKGYIVRTRADADTHEARTNDRSTFEAAVASGAQIITTDYYKKSTQFPSEYMIAFDGNVYLRKNPVLK